MIKISKSEIKEEISRCLELGFTNAEIADRLNEKYGADEKNKLNASKVGKLKKAVGLEGTKPKGKQLFELVEDYEITAEVTKYPELELTQEEIEAYQTMDDYESHLDINQPEVELLDNPFQANPNSIY